MNAETIIQEIELATWAMAEAESLEKRAHKLRVDATRTLAKVRLEMVDALEEAKQKRNDERIRGDADARKQTGALSPSDDAAC